MKGRSAHRKKPVSRRVFFGSVGIALMACFFEAAAHAGLNFQDTAPEKIDFFLKDIDGRGVTLDEILSDHKVVLLNFTATWCSFCKECVPGLIDLEKKYGDKGLAVVSIFTNDVKKKVAAYAETMGLNYQILLDPEGQAADRYGAVRIPVNFLLGYQGKKLGTYSRVTPDLKRKIQNELRRSAI